MYIMIENNISFRLLSELYSLLFKNASLKLAKKYKEFPSPLGVIFSLIVDEVPYNVLRLDGFRLLSELYSLLFSFGEEGGWKE